MGPGLAGRHPRPRRQGRLATAAGALLAVLVLALGACAGPTPPFAGTGPVQVTLTSDGETRVLTSEATTVRELLIETRVAVGEADEVSPPLFTPLADGLEITVVRVRESIVLIERTVPFTRRIVRNESLSADDPPRIIQGGKPGLEELTVRIVYRDGLESERRTTQVNVVEQARDEIVMVGIGAGTANVRFDGLIAYISGNRAVLMRGQSTFAESLETGADLDGRVFRLSPTGAYLLYTRVTTDTQRFNSLYVVGTARGSAPRSLGVANVLWADWNPTRLELPEIAYTTAEATELPPGWEANNDLWLGDVGQNPDRPFEPRQIVEAYPATYGWWGGNYAWSPEGDQIAFAFADEVGVLSLPPEDEDPERLPVQRFVEFNTRSDWVWVPSLTWSPDGTILAFTRHGGDDDSAAVFDTWAANISAGGSAPVAVPLARQSGMWSHPHWAGASPGRLAYLQTQDPAQSDRSGYTLWIMDGDGSNASQVYPPPGEISRFPRDEQFMSWGPTGQELVFVFDHKLYLFDLTTLAAVRLIQDDTPASHPTWAPYGTAITADASPAEVLPLPTRVPVDDNDFSGE